MNFIREFFVNHGLFPWDEPGMMSLAESIGIGAIVLFFNLFFCIIVGSSCYFCITEIGYTQSKRMKQKRKNKILKSIPLKEKILMAEVFNKAPSKTFYMFLHLIFYYIDWLIALTCIVSYFCIIYSRGAGWSLNLACAGVYYCIFHGLLTLIPDIIFIKYDIDKSIFGSIGKKKKK